jgi:hypothetical protein
MPPHTNLQARCELGQQQLMRTEYLEAEKTLASAEAEAWAARDWDTLSRLYMPLQEARRQIRQRCGEGIVCLDLIAAGQEDEISGQRIVANFPHGQLLVAGWGTIQPALDVRRLQREHDLYVETFLAAVYPIGAGVGSDAGARAVVIAPTEDVALPDVHPATIDDLVRKLPAHCIVMSTAELPSGSRRGTTQTYAEVMALWERLHAPFLAAADMQVNPLQKIDGYRKTLEVDYACELAHQKLSDTAHALFRGRRTAPAQ